MTSIVIGKDRISVLEAERYVSGTANVYQIKVAFSEDWEGLEKHLVFRTYKDSTSCPNDLAVDIVGCSEQFPIPSEIFKSTANRIQVGCYGKCGDAIVLNTRWTTLGKIVSGTIGSGCGCQVPSMPSPATYEALKNLINAKADRLTYEDGQFILWAGDKVLSAFYAPTSLPSGGSKGQILAKASDEDGDYEWISVDGLSGSESGLSLNVPIGTIQIWSGSINSIPESYSLCDGQNGTPDLRKAMILGASESIEPGTVVNAPLEDIPMPINAESDGIRYYALAFIQKTSLTEADEKHGQTAFDIAVENGFEGTEEEWLDSLKGKSAYDLAVENGFEGTEEDWLNSLGSSVIESTKDKTITSIEDLPGFGAIMVDNVWVNPSNLDSNNLYLDSDVIYVRHPDPETIVITTLENKVYECKIGEDGKAIESITERVPTSGGDGQPGTPGADGKDGASAYDIAVENGFEGSVTEWLESLKGPKGDSAYEVAVANGFSRTEEEWLASLKGSTGLSAYQVAKANGFEGTEAEWVESLKGADGLDGADGKSAYEIAVDNGYTGTEQEWVEEIQNGSAEDSSFDDSTTNLGASTVQEAIEKLVTLVEAGDNITKVTDKTISSKNDLLEAGLGDFSGTIQIENTSFAGTTLPNGYIYLDVKEDSVTVYTLDGLRTVYAFTEEGQLTVESITDAYANGTGGTGGEGQPGRPGADGKDGKSAYEIAVENGFEGSVTEWLESLKGQEGPEGPQGIQGEPGANGKSAYELAVEGGFEGSEEEWFESLRGAPGEDGIEGPPGKDGSDGFSAYDIAVINGFEGTEEEWLESLKGQDGKSAYQIALDNGFQGSEEDWLVSLVGPAGEDGTDGTDGKDGLSAYEVAVANGYDGGITQWLESLKGAQGDSAYEIAVETGFEGTKDEWIASLKGDKGDAGTDGADGQNGSSAYELAVQNGFEGSEAEWLESLKGATGAKGKSAYQLAVDAGFEGDEAAWLLSLKGAKGDKGDKGDSNYDIAVENGFEGTEEEWLQTVTGPEGPEGKSAYQVAVDNGYEGTVNQWLDSLKGEGIAEFITYADQTITSRDTLVKIDSDKVAHFERCKLAAADGNSVVLNDELLFIEPSDLSLKVYRANGETITIEFGEDEVFTTLTVSKIEGIPGQNGSDGKSAYEIAVEEGFEGTKTEWLASLRGEPGLPGETVQRLEDYSTTPTVIGRWIDKKPVKRQVIAREITIPEFTDSTTYELGHLDQNLIITKMITIVTVPDGDTTMVGGFKTQLPAMVDDIWIDNRYYYDKPDNNTYLVLKGSSASSLNLSLTTILEYVDPTDGELSDDDMIVSGSGGAGVSDHRLLSNRDAIDQHPISAISTLTDRLAVTPTSAITDEQIDALFN